MATFPMVTIEKAEKLDVGNASAEVKIAETLRAVKSLNASVFGVAYFNSVLNWPFYALSAEVDANSSLQLKDAAGDAIRIPGDKSFPQPKDGMLVFDLGDEGMQEAWQRDCRKVLAASGGEGCFADRMNQQTFPQKMDPSVLARYQAGHYSTMAGLQEQLDAAGGGLVIANNEIVSGVRATMLEGFSASEDSIQELAAAAKQGLVVQAHAGYQQDGADNHCTGVNNSLAAFLMAAEEHSYFACTRGWQVGPGQPNDALKWHAIYDAPLGAPLGPATKDANGVYSRNFSAGTTVTFDTKTNTGAFLFATDSHQTEKTRRNQ